MPNLFNRLSSMPIWLFVRTLEDAGQNPLNTRARPIFPSSLIRRALSLIFA
jgi:hypothetical protein